MENSEFELRTLGSYTIQNNVRLHLINGRECKIVMPDKKSETLISIDEFRKFAAKQNITLDPRLGVK